MAATLEVSLDGATRECCPGRPGTRMLDVLIDDGLDAPYSCRQGICGACACQLTGGEVEMAHNEVLEAEDLADGYILACQAVPLTRRSASPTDRARRGGPFVLIPTRVKRTNRRATRTGSGARCRPPAKTVTCSSMRGREVP